MDENTTHALKEVTATLNHLEPSSERPYVYMYDAPPGIPERTGSYRGHAVAIRDVRPIAKQLSLSKQGFVLLSQQTRVGDFYDDAEVKAVYYRELEDLVRELTGGSKAMMFDHTLRSARAGGRADNVKDPVKVAHNDYTFASGPQRLRDLLPAEASVKRFGIYNVWRPIRGPVYDTPLALCDARTIAKPDLIATEMRYRDRMGETFAIVFNPNQCWYYAPRMQRDEVLVFKCFDSAPGDGPPFTAHTAFDDPTAPAEAPPRESIEARLLVLDPLT